MLPSDKNFFIIFLYFLGVLFVFCGGYYGTDDMHSSIPALEEVLEGEKYLMENLAAYISKSEAIIKFVKRFLIDFKEEYFKMVQNVSHYETIDVHHHSILLKKQWPLKFFHLQDYLNRTVSKMIESYIKVATEYNLPTSTDLIGVTLGLLRIQEVYEISAEQIASGMINNINFGRKFAASDCLNVGFTLHLLDLHYYAIPWYKEVLKLIASEGWKGITPKINKSSVLDFLAYSQYMEGSIENVKASIETELSALNYEYNTSKSVVMATNLKSYIKTYIELKEGTKKQRKIYPPKGALHRHNLTELQMLKKGCRGELIKTPEEQRNLFCKYERKNHPFLILAPIKVEALNLDPYLAIMHDVIYDSEIEILKELSNEKLFRAGVWLDNKGKGAVSLTRTSKIAWLENETHPLMHTLNQRVSDMTGLSMETAEGYQLMNYGMGGHYEVHADYFKETEGKDGTKLFGGNEFGNRIATVLFYLSDVSHGGGTTWPNINVLTLPKKGAAAFWYNLCADGEPNYLSRHSACPIIAGSKWVVNKWIRLRGQEFRRPCLIYPDSEKMN